MPCKFTNPKIQLLDDNAVTYLMFLSFEICIMGSVLIIGPLQNCEGTGKLPFNGELLSSVIICHLYKKISC